MVDFEGSKHDGFNVENGGEKEFDMNTNSLQEASGKASPGTRVLAADANGVVVLPAGVSPEDIDAQGRDIVITLADGSTIVIPDGAIIVPQLVIDGVAIPPQTVAALLNGAEDINPEDAPGQLPSSGGEFDDGESFLQDAFDLGDLLPYTELSREVVVEEEIIPFENEEPDVVIETPDNPVGVENAIATVDEDGLPVRSDEPEGTRDETDSEITSGTIVFNAPDGLSAIIMNGEEITSVGQTFTTPYGTLEITSIDLDAGEIGFIYTLEDNLLGETVDGNFSVTVVDRDGDTATANLSIIVIDDNPIAVLDTNTVAGGTFGPIFGNVLDNDESGADDYPVGEEGVEAVISFTNGTDTAGPGETLTGQWGELTLNADGTYSYTRFYNTPGDQTDTFNYTITDQDGSTASADLVITIGDAPNEITFVPEIGEGTEVYEGGLPPRGDEPVGSGEGADDNPDNNSDPSEETGSTVTFNSPDGVESVTVNGVTIDPNNLPQTVVNDATGTLVITGYTYDPVTGDGTITYEYTLGDNTSGDDTSVSFVIEVTDLDGDMASDTLTIDIIDDEPEAVADTDEVTEDGPLTAEGNVITDAEANGDDGMDTVGADDASVSGVAFGAPAGDVDGNVGTGVDGDYGTLVLNADGSYTYTLDNTNELVQGLDKTESLTETFTYTLKDGDGDTSTTSLTITINGADDPVVIHGLDGEGAEEVVDEDDLADGTSPDADALTQDGTFTITSVDGLASLTLGGTPVFGGGVVYPVTITGDYGDLRITGIVTETDANGDVVSATVSYEYELTDNTLDHPAAGEDSLFDNFEVIATDTDGSEDIASLDVRVIDDVPETDENDAITLDDDDLTDGNPGGDGDVDSSVSTSGTLAHDFGADGGSIDFAVMDGEEVVIGGVTVTFSWDSDTNTLTANDGSNDVFNVVLNPATGEFTVNQLNPLDHHLVGDDYEGTPEFDLTYTVTDGDDDTATGTLTVRVNDDTPEFGEVEDEGEGEGGLPKLYTDDTNVDPDTNATDSDSAFFSGLFNPLFGADGAAATDPIVYSFAITGGDDTDSGLNDSITDENILLRISDSDPNVMEGYLETSGDLAFTLTLDPETSEITQEQFRAIEHDDADDHIEDGAAAESMAAGLITLTATITDGDDDQAENTVDIGDAFNFTDDGPSVPGQLVWARFDEDELAEGNDDTAAGDDASLPGNSFTSGFVFDFGADGPNADELTVSVNSVTTTDPSVGAVTLMSGGQTVNYSWDAATNTLTGYTSDVNDPVFTLSFSVDNNEVTFTLLKPLDHPSTDADGANDGPEIGYEDNLTINFDITITDGDGDTFETNLAIDIDDDMAVAGADAITIGEGESDGGTVLGNDSAGADGYAAAGPVVDANFVSGDQGIDIVPNGKTVAPDGTITIVTTAGTLVLHTDGTYTFEADANTVNADADIVFTYTIEDGDGDQTTANLTITIENVAGRVEDDDAYVDEGGLPDVGTGELNAPADDVDFDGEVDQDPESDQSEVDANGSIRALDNLGDPLVGDFTYSLDDVNATPGPGANEVTLIGNYGTLVLNTETGAYTYTLTTRYDHEDGLGENDSSSPPPADSFAYTVTDQFGNEIGTGSIDVTIKDDIPVIEAELDSGSTVSVDETDMVQGDATIDLDGNTQGSDSDVSGSPTIVSGTTAAGGNGVFNITTLLYGADGEAIGGGLDYDLVVNSSVSGLSTTEGDPIVLVAHSTDSNVVLGMVDGTDTVAFAIEIDDATGELTVEQYLSLHHTQPTDDLSLQLTAGSLQAVVSATDGDADEVSIEAIDITSLITFLDDDPSVVLVKGNGELSVDEENLAQGSTSLDLAGFGYVQGSDDDVTGTPTIVSSSPVVLTSVTTADYGADGEGVPDITYSLSLDNVDGTTTTASTLLETTEEQSISLVKVSDTLVLGVIDGGNTVAFAIILNADTGAVTLEQYVSLEHGDNTPATDVVALALNDLYVGAAITDGDNDTTDVDYAAVGSAISFGDDLPSVEAEVDSGSTVSVDETDMVQGSGTIDLDGNTQGSDDDVTGSPTIVSGSTTPGGNGVLNLTTLDFGADGEAATGSVNYNLLIGNPTSGLSTTEGTAINLVGHTTDSNIVLGMVDGTDIVAFAIEIDDTTGEITIEQYLSLQHTQPTDDLSLQLDEGSLLATVTIKDGDEDIDTTEGVDITSLITFYDDDPAVVIATNGASISVDESNLAVADTTLDLASFTQGTDADVADGLNPTLVASVATSLTTLTTEDYGADGEGSPDLLYKLSLDDGDTLSELATSLQTTEEEDITLVKVSDTLIVGEIGNTGVAAFAISIDADTGEVTLEQYVSVEHGDNVPSTSSVSLALNQLFVGVTIEDGDEDTATDYVAVGSGISFLDDTPTGGSNATIQLDDDNWAGSDGNVGVAGDATDGAGTDDIQSVSTSGTLTHDFGNDGGSIAFATTGAPDGFRYQASGSDILIQQEQGTDNWVTVVTVTLNPATGAYSVTQNDNVLHDNADAENNVEFTLSYTVTDGDEDTAPGTLVINVDDDTPVAIAGNITVTVDEDGLQGGIANNGTNDAVGDSTGILTNFSSFFSAGADAPLTYAFDTTASGSLPTLYSGGVLVTYVVTATSITATAGGSPVFTFTILDQSTGAAQFTLQGPLDHADTDDSENVVDITVDFGPLITATDADGDTVTKAGSYNVVIDDDSPSFGANNATAPVLVTDDTNIPVTDSDGNDFSTLFTPLYGADGPAAGTSITYALSITGGDGTPSGLVDSVTGKNIYLYLESGEIVGRVGDSNNDPDDTGAVAFTLSVNASGTIEQEQVRAIYHNDPTDPHELYNADPLLDASESMAADLIKLTATITDYDGDSVTSDPISIGDSFHFEDDGPSLLVTDPLQINNDGTPSGSGGFGMIIGADVNADDQDLSITNFTASVNGSPVTLNSFTETSEDAVSANYSFSFDYDTGTGGTATATGTMVFYKSGPKGGTYEVELTSGPIEGFTINSTSDPSTAIVEVNPNVSVAGFDVDFFAQFTGIAEPNSGTGTNNLRTIDYDPDGTPSPELPAPGAWEEGELFDQAASTVQVSSTAAGVGGNTIQGGEVLDFNLYSSDPGGTTGGVPTASATSMYLKFDTVGSSEDMIVVLKLWNDTNGNGIIESTDEFTTRALMVENSDILKTGPLPAPYNLITLDNNDGIIFIESNDYNGAGETYQVVGAQIVGSDEGVTGMAIDFNNNTGIGGASNVDDTGTYQALSTDTDNGPFKITSIGFVRPSTSDQTATLEFDVTVTDADGDSVTQTDVTVTFGDFPATPIVLDLDGGGNEFVSASSNLAAYDYDGDGVKTKTAWIAAGSAILFHDTNGDGVVTDASEFVFGHDGMTDMEAVLKLYDSNNNGQLDQGDAEYGKFGVWMDDGDAQAEDGEFASLESMHITSIDLVSDGIQTVDGDGDVTIYGTSTFSIDGVVAGEASDAAFALGSDVDGAMMDALLAMSTEEGSDDGDTRTTEEVNVIVKDVLAEDAVDAMLNEITGHDEVQTADAGAFDAATLTHVIDGGAYVFDNSYAAVMDDHAAAELAAV